MNKTQANVEYNRGMSRQILISMWRHNGKYVV